MVGDDGRRKGEKDFGRESEEEERIGGTILKIIKANLLKN